MSLLRAQVMELSVQLMQYRSLMQSLGGGDGGKQHEGDGGSLQGPQGPGSSGGSCSSSLAPDGPGRQMVQMLVARLDATTHELADRDQQIQQLAAQVGVQSPNLF